MRFVTGTARLQADYPLYKQFKAASSRYQIELAAWVRTQRDWWLRLGGTSFEVEAGSVFSRRGYVVRRVGGSGDQGVDLLLTKGGVTIAVQCKAHRLPVGPSVVRDLFGAMVHHGCREAWLLSTSGFTKGARAFAAGKPIKLLSVDDLL
jgi:restriction system protein